MGNGRALRDRVAAQSAMAVVVAAQAEAPPQSALQRLFGVSPLGPACRIAYRDALAELIVGDELEHLGVRWDVLHDLPLGATTLDHLLIGPVGVFAVRAAHHGDRDVVLDDDLVVGGEATGDVPDALRQAREAAKRLSRAAGETVPVRPLVVVVVPRRFIERSVPAEVIVAASGELDRVLHRLPRVLAGTDVARISDLADLESTWPEPHQQSVDVQTLHRSFGAVRDRVREAFVRRLVWSLIGIALAAVALWILIARFVALVVAS